MNDPRTTAYALNQLQGTEREKFESDLANDPLLQRDLLAACEITDALGEVAEEPGEGLEPQAREKLLRAIAANQEAFRARRKIVRFAIPVSLAAAASIAVLLWVSGGTATQEHPVAAARVPEAAGLARGAGTAAPEAVFTFNGDGQLSQSRLNPAGRIIALSANGKAAKEFRAQMMLTSNLNGVQVSKRSLLSDEKIQLLGIAP